MLNQLRVWENHPVTSLVLAWLAQTLVHRLIAQVTLEMVAITRDLVISEGVKL